MASALWPAPPPGPEPILFTAGLLLFVVAVFASAKWDVVRPFLKICLAKCRREWLTRPHARQPLHLAGWLLFGSHAVGVFKLAPYLAPLTSFVQWTSVRRRCFYQG